MATITIPQLNTVTVPTGNDLIEVVQPDSGSASGYATGKESLSQVANLIANGTQFSGLTTTNQSLVGAINEVKETSSENLAEAYDGTATYNEGDYCTYNGVLYVCNTDNTTGTWDAQYWDAVKITDVLGSGIEEETFTGSLDSPVGTGSMTYHKVGNIVVVNGTYTCNTPIGANVSLSTLHYLNAAAFNGCFISSGGAIAPFSVNETDHRIILTNGLSSSDYGFNFSYFTGTNNNS